MNPTETARLLELRALERTLTEPEKVELKALEVKEAAEPKV